MHNSKIGSLVKKGKSIFNSGIDPVIEGMNNFNHPIDEFERLAEERTLTCIGCPKYMIEPIESFRVIDIKIPELSEMFCDDCGCTLSYKLRQSIKKCPLWLK